MTHPLQTHVSLNSHLFSKGTPDDLRFLILDISRAVKYIHFALRTTEAGLAGTVNQFGEEQIKLDVLSDEIIQKHLMESRLVATLISEEQKDVIELSSKAPYSVVYDPLDGSSLVDVNFAIGSIFGIYKGKDVIGRKPKEQVAALYTIYGPRTLLVYSTGDGVHEFILNDVGEFVLIREYLGVADDAKNYSPGNLSKDNDSYKNLMLDWLDRGMTLRYSGCMVADVHHILSKGQGVFLNVGNAKHPNGKLRHAFECGPFAYLVTQAGGSASDGTIDILEKTIDSVDQRTPLIIGSKNEVARVTKMLG